MPQHRVKRFGWARAAKQDAYAMYLAARDPRVPWDAKALAFLVAVCFEPYRPDAGPWR
jgi:hypothetical protein